jgi:hypothetical protein
VATAPASCKRLEITLQSAVWVKDRDVRARDCRHSQVHCDRHAWKKYWASAINEAESCSKLRLLCARAVLTVGLGTRAVSSVNAPWSSVSKSSLKSSNTVTLLSLGRCSFIKDSYSKRHIRKTFLLLIVISYLDRVFPVRKKSTILAMARTSRSPVGEAC